MKKLSLLVAFAIVSIFACSAWAINIAPMTWTTGRSDWINVKTDSAMTIHAAGNGTTDDTAALQQALNLASASHATRTTVYLPSGTYKISSTLYWSANFSAIQHWPGAYGLWLVGCGSNTTITWAGTAGKAMFLDQGSSRSHYEGIVWNAGPSGSAAGFGVAHVGLAYYQTRMRHENEAFIGFTGVSGSGTINPPYAYTLTSGVVSTGTTLPVGVTTIPLSSIPTGLVTGAGVTGTGMPTGTGGATTTTVTAINTGATPPTITISAATNHTITNGTTLSFCSSVAGTPETIPAAGIMAGSARETIPMAETMIWNCLFQNDTNGVIVGYEVYNNYMWIFKNDEFESCGTAILPGDGKQVIMDCHFAGSTVVDVYGGVTTRVRRCTSSGSKMFFLGGTTGSPGIHVLEDCWVDGWTNVNGAIYFGDRSDEVFDCTFTHPPATGTGDIYASPSTTLDLTLSNNYTNSTTVPLTSIHGSTNVINVPAGGLIPNVQSPTQTFLQTMWPADGPTILDITAAPYNAVRGTDCTTAIQSAITQAKTNNNGTVVYVPAGSFQTTATLNVTGRNYTIQGSGYLSQLAWAGSTSSTIPMFTVTTPQEITMEQMLVNVGSVSGVSSQPCVSETSTGASSIIYDQVSSGAYTSSPGIVLTSLPAGSTVDMPLCDSALTINDCGPATIFSDYFCTNGTSVTGKTHAKTGFAGVLAMEGGQMVSSSAWDVTINDNQDFIGVDYYNEQSYNHLLAENTDGATWTGRVSFQGMKEESDAPSTTIGIQNFGGRVFYGSQGFLNNASSPIFTQTGTAAVDLVMLGNTYYSSPTFTLTSACNLIQANGLYTSPTVTYIANTLPTGWGASAAAGFDHFRQADGYDLALNYGWNQAFVNTSFEADAPNPTPTTVIGYNPASWTIANSLAAGGGARNITVVTTASPFAAGTQGLLYVDTTGTVTGSAVSSTATIEALPANEGAVWSVDFRLNSTGTHSDVWLKCSAGGSRAGYLHMTYNGTSTYLGADIGGHDSYVMTPLVNTWYRARIVVGAASAGASNATLYLTPWTSTGPGTTTTYTIDGISAVSTSGISALGISSGSGPGVSQNVNLDNFTASDNTLFALP